MIYFNYLTLSIYIYLEMLLLIDHRDSLIVKFIVLFLQNCLNIILIYEGFLLTSNFLRKAILLELRHLQYL